MSASNDGPSYPLDPAALAWLDRVFQGQDGDQLSVEEFTQRAQEAGPPPPLRGSNSGPIITWPYGDGTPDPDAA